LPRPIGSLFAEGPKTDSRAERYEELTNLLDTMEKILVEMDPSDPLYLRAISRMLIAENMITEHLLSAMAT
jgi:hypothetical protein